MSTESNSIWEEKFRSLYERVHVAMARGERALPALFNEADRVFLGSIGSKPIEVFDAVDDWIRHGEPSFEEVLEIHRMRRDYFLGTQGGRVETETPAGEFRAKDAQLGGIAWLPRAVDKARAKLQGKLPDDFFYPCSGDRRFLKEIGFKAVDFFRLVREAKDDDEILRKIRAFQNGGQKESET